MPQPKKLPYAVGNFEEIVEDNYYFIDKTAYLAELEKYKTPVFLRPRRFGKSLWCSVLECYYDIKRQAKFDLLFGPYAIGKQPTPLRHSLLVLRFNFSKIAVKPDLDYIEHSFQGICRTAIDGFCTYYREYFQTFQYDAQIPISDQVAEITGYIKKHNLPALYVIIDEYDNFTNQLIVTHQDDLYYELTTGDSFFRTFFKVLKAGIEERAIDRVFITGVLPITIDDLTSGFNIAEIITLRKPTLHMLGFTQAEVDAYLERVITDYGFDASLIPTLQMLLITYYNGYKFLPNDETPLYNSTILTFFLKQFTLEGGELPWEFIDDNLRTDLNWIKRLSNNPDITKTMLETLMFHNELPYDADQLRSKFNMNQFFEKDFYPVSLFYLGMLTIQDEFTMRLPNQTMRKIFTEYFNLIEDLEVSKGYTDMFRQFLHDLSIEHLFAGYFATYIGQLPAQIFDQVNENFYRTTFYELCTRYLSQYFTLSIEVNYPSGRTDFEMLGKYHTRYKDQKFLVEFKFCSSAEAQKLKFLNLTAPREDDIEQVKRYERDMLRQFPALQIRTYLIYIAGNKGFRCFEVSDPEVT